MLLLCGWSNSRCELLVARYILHHPASPVKAWISSSELLHFSLLISYNERSCCELAFPLIFLLQLIIPWNPQFLIRQEAVWEDKHSTGQGNLLLCNESILVYRAKSSFIWIITSTGISLQVADIQNKKILRKHSLRVSLFLSLPDQLAIRSMLNSAVFLLWGAWGLIYRY